MGWPLDWSSLALCRFWNLLRGFFPISLGHPTNSGWHLAFTFMAHPHRISVSYFSPSRALCFLYTRADNSKTVSAIILVAPRSLHSSVTLLLPPESASVCTCDCTLLNFICVWRLKWMLFCLHMTFVWKWVLWQEGRSQRTSYGFVSPLHSLCTFQGSDSGVQALKQQVPLLTGQPINP